MTTIQIICLALIIFSILIFTYKFYRFVKTMKKIEIKSSSGKSSFSGVVPKDVIITDEQRQAMIKGIDEIECVVQELTESYMLNKTRNNIADKSVSYIL